MDKEIKIIGFSVDAYKRHNTDQLFLDGDVKNIVPLEKMTSKQRYELALGDDEDTIIYDNIDSFLVDLNDGVVDSEGYFFYQYKPNVSDYLETPSKSEIQAYSGHFTRQRILATISELDAVLGKHKKHSAPKHLRTLPEVQFNWFAKYKNKLYEIYDYKHSERILSEDIVDFHIGTSTKNPASDSEVNEFKSVLKELIKQSQI